MIANSKSIDATEVFPTFALSIFQQARHVSSFIYVLAFQFQLFKALFYIFNGHILVFVYIRRG